MVAYVIRDNELTTMSRYKLDAEFSGAIHIEES